MKKFVLFMFVALLTISLEAQIQTPAPSPFSVLKQTVGLTEVTVEYSRPSMRGRTIFGDLVPYDAVWRTGANMNTKITFSDDVKVEGKDLKAGTYAIYTRPTEAVWEVIFYTDSENGGLPQEWDASKVAATVKVEVYPIPMPIETFTISIDDMHNDGASLGLMWEKVYVGVKFVVPTVAKATASIQKVMSGSDISANDYFAAAQYYYQEGMNMGEAKQWIDKAVSMNDKAFWMTRVQSLIYAKTGDTKGAIEAAKKSLVEAQAAGNADYVKMNKESLKEWEMQ
ncbi:DUF2911 domain-containing protein [Muricauda sp. CAU 1633]|uniref:DUF2911 domain-containing protein n=1 Tax=Allomuricauda sp. CAU 1633 TaxID=2816036 RepID=UPI001A8D08A3|nr:DUF2911 domain-containing protein [Muricauda sp. CAU 1633]MBO0323418.1 DUF2911 domain-containing protein [Muricauda sp. CAU 1633]